MSLDGDWLRPYLPSPKVALAVPYVDLSGFDHARFIDSQPVTPLSQCAPITPSADKPRNAFGMETLEEFDSPGINESPAKGDVHDFMPPAAALAAGA